MMSKYLKGNIMPHRGHSGTDVRMFRVCLSKSKNQTLDVILLKIIKLHNFINCFYGTQA